MSCEHEFMFLMGGLSESVRLWKCIKCREVFEIKNLDRIKLMQEGKWREIDNDG